MLFNNPEFKKLSILAFVSALLIVGGLYLTMWPIIIQIILLLIGLLCGVFTFAGLIKFLAKMNKEAK